MTRKILATALMALFLIGLAPSYAKAAERIDLVFFYGEGCPHCSKMQMFLDQMTGRYPTLTVSRHEVYFDEAGRSLYLGLAEAMDQAPNGVPMSYVGERVFTGYNEAIAEEIEGVIVGCARNGCPSPLAALTPNPPASDRTGQVVEDPAPVADTKAARDTTDSSSTTTPASATDDGQPLNDVPQTGHDRQSMLKHVTVPAVLAAAAVDAINPCAFAVLVVLLSTVLATSSRRRGLLTGLAFSASIFVSYFLMGLGLYSAISLAGASRFFFGAMAVLAILLGLFNLKDYLYYGKWFLMEVPLSWRPRLKALIRGVASVPGAFLIGFAVSLFLLPCTSGPYVVILGLLSESTTRNAAMAYLLLYNLVFVSPMIAITAAIFFGLTTADKIESWRTKQLKVLHLIAGLILLFLGIGMLVAMRLGSI